MTGCRACSRARGDSGNTDCTFFEPACGHGNFLVEILRRKLEYVTPRRYGRGERFEHRVLRCLASVYGIDISEDNVGESRERMRSVISGHVEDHLGAGGPTSGFGDAVEAILETNIIRADALADAAEVELVEYRARLRHSRLPRPALQRQGADAAEARASGEHSVVRFDEEAEDLKFDVIVGNPPYQIGVGGNTRTRAIFPEFVLRAMAMNPRHLVMITPSRWFTGGANLNEMRDTLLADRRMEALVDYPKLYDCFPGVKIRGGVSYFHWSRDHDGPCAVQTMWAGSPTGPPVRRYLDEYDIFVRGNEAVEILRKVRAAGEPTVDGRVLSFNPFGFQTNHHGVDDPSSLEDPIEFYGSKRRSWMERDAITVNSDVVGHHKLLLHRAYGEDGDPPFRVTAAPKVLAADTACSGTYLVIATSPEAQTAERWGTYARTRFFRFLVSLQMNTQDLKRGTFAFVPDLPMDREWTDAGLCERYGLSDEEIEFIEAQVKEMPGEVGLWERKAGE